MKKWGIASWQWFLIDIFRGKNISMERTKAEILRGPFRQNKGRIEPIKRA
jgi:hypothetical protein